MLRQGIDQEDRLRLVLEAVPSAMVLVDEAGRIALVNAEAEQIFGYDHAKFLTLTVEDLMPARFRPTHSAERAAYAESPDRRAMGVGRELFGLRADGSEMPIEIGLNPLTVGDERFVLASIIDITERLRNQEIVAAARHDALQSALRADMLDARERIEHLATHDSLTNLPNRALLVRHLDQAIERAERTSCELALVLVDLDHFKRINDALGHHLGDELLIVIAERLLSWTRGADLVARLGGDEFVIVLEDLTPGVDLDARIEALMEVVLAPAVVHGYELAVTASIGGARFPADGRDPAALLKHADIAMYQAKDAGRNATAWFAPEMLAENTDRLALSAALRQALDQDELSLVYQPQVDLTTGRVVGVEALARWDSATLGPVPPDRFIAVAEDGGMIIQFGGWVLTTACQALARLQRHLGRPLRLAVNVSPRQMRGTAWLEEIRAAIADAGIEPSQLEVEITEGLLIEDHGDVVAMLQSLRALGVAVVVDDFGCGYSSLAYLTRFPIDKIKIDRSFVQEINGQQSAPIVDAIIVMAHALGMTVVAEGVETEVQERYLRDRGCDEVQGYLYSPGVPAGTIPMVAQALGG